MKISKAYTPVLFWSIFPQNLIVSCHKTTSSG